MKTSTQTDSDLAHVAALIDDIPIAMLTTTEADGALTSRPMAVLEMDEQGTLWFFTDSRSSKTEQLRMASLSLLTWRMPRMSHCRATARSAMIGRR